MPHTRRLKLVPFKSDPSGPLLGLLGPSGLLGFSPDADCDLNHVALESRRADYRTAMVNSGDFGGAEMSVIVQRD